MGRSSMRMDQASVRRRGEQLYERYGKPLEAEHAGKFVAISPKGDTIVGESMLDVAKRAATELGHGNFVFRLGPRSVGKWR